MSSAYWPEISFYLREIDKELALFPIKQVNPELIENLRKNISHQMNQLKYSLLSTLDNHPATLILFAIAAVLDEEIQQMVSENEPMYWPPLSKDYYGDYTAGELFYRCLDESLDNQKTPSIVFEVFFFALKRGFKGRYRESKLQINKYLDLLSQKIQLSDKIQVQNIDTVRRPLSSTSRLTKRQYYGIAASGTLLLYGSLYWASNWMV